MDLFFAERHTTASNFNITTGLGLLPCSEVLVLADAGGPYVFNEGDIVTLDGSGSSHPDGEIVLYEWDLDDDGQFDDATGVAPSFLMEDDASLTIHLRVTGETANRIPIPPS